MANGECENVKREDVKREGVNLEDVRRDTDHASRFTFHASRITLYALTLILLAYLLVATLYAIFTPAWQVPDEPAHFNYARYLAQTRQLPVLQPGDYPHAYLEQIKTLRFPPDMSIDPIRYEFHQPPLYYVLAAGVYALFAGVGLPAQLLAMRLLSVAFGALLLLVSYRSVTLIFPRRPALALGATAFIAFVPMRVAMSAGVNNDGLADLLLGLVLLLLLRYILSRNPVGHALSVTSDSPAARSLPTRAHTLLLLGFLLGLIMICKSTVYIALPLAGLALLWRELYCGRPGHRLADLVRAITLVGAPALLIAGPWFLRNSLVYGGFDILGLGRHDAIVEGQRRTPDLIAQMGLKTSLLYMARTAFQSFWAQFGWMGILVDSRIYNVLYAFSGLTLLGVALAFLRRVGLWPTIPPFEPAQAGFANVAATSSRPKAVVGHGPALALLGLTLLFTLLSFVWYNLQFVQPQGRYLFRALLPIGLLVAIAWRALLTRRGSLVAALVLAASALILLIYGFIAGDLPTFWLALSAGLAIAFVICAAILPRAWSAALTVLPYAGLFILDFVCLFGFIVPYFRG
jgi:4-amino-4-deoxy-L-arabinose transferase-like glycosyltransferase